jgi:chemotaxis response regulator CheB
MALASLVVDGCSEVRDEKSMNYSLESIKVLVIDDHPKIRHGIKTMSLTFDDIDVVGEAGNGLEALACCQETTPDVILMDGVMPGMSGVETDPCCIGT